MTDPGRQLLAAEVRPLYPELASLGPGALEAVLARSQLVRVPAGTPMFGEGSSCRQFPLVLEGSIRVAKCGDAREPRLYQVTPGEICVLTSGCLVGGRLVALTHQQLADELGSVREIVTRVLRSLAEQGLVGSSRGAIEVLDANGLRRVAEGAAAPVTQVTDGGRSVP